MFHFPIGYAFTKSGIALYKMFEGGDVLYQESRDLLKADIVQMAHHGHAGCGMEIYAAINPEL